MSEQEPLLPAYNPDPTQGHADPLYSKYQHRTAEVLEHPTLHKLVIALASGSLFSMIQLQG
jgi:hypothetical protein